MSNEIALAYQWVYSTMAADSALTAAATGGIWQGMADIGTQPPFVLFTEQSGLDSLTLTAKRVMSRLLLQIVAIGPVNPSGSGYAALVTIANRIDALFGDVKNVGLPGGTVMATCYREQPFSMSEPPINGAAWSRLGGLYHIDVQSP